jgi:hypothetical protein
MFVVPSGVRVATLATGVAAAAGSRRAIDARRTGAQYASWRAGSSGRAGPGVNAGVTIAGAAAVGAVGLRVEREPSAAVTRPAASAAIAHAASAPRLTP